MEKKVNLNRSYKKQYAPPLLVRHGDVDEITQKGGFSFTDVPIGTPVADGITSVAS